MTSNTKEENLEDSNVSNDVNRDFLEKTTMNCSILSKIFVKFDFFAIAGERRRGDERACQRHPRLSGETRLSDAEKIRPRLTIKSISRVSLAILHSF